MKIAYLLFAALVLAACSEHETGTWLDPLEIIERKPIVLDEIPLPAHAIRTSAPGELISDSHVDEVRRFLPPYFEESAEVLDYFDQAGCREVTAQSLGFKNRVDTLNERYHTLKEVHFRCPADAPDRVYVVSKSRPIPGALDGTWIRYPSGETGDMSDMQKEYDYVTLTITRFSPRDYDRYVKKYRSKTITFDIPHIYSISF